MRGEWVSSVGFSLERDDIGSESEFREWLSTHGIRITGKAVDKYGYRGAVRTIPGPLGKEVRSRVRVRLVDTGGPK